MESVSKGFKIFVSDFYCLLLFQVIYLETERENDLVILSPQWLCSDVIGLLLSHERIAHSRPTGCYTAYDFQLMFPDCDAADLLRVLEALELCTQCDLDGDVEFEFPCLNFVETLAGLWEKDSRRYQNYVYGGMRLQYPHAVTNQLLYLFPRIQVHLRRNIIAQELANADERRVSNGVELTYEDGLESGDIIHDSVNNSENDIYQWHHGSKYVSQSVLECLITLEQGDVVELKLRGPQDCATQLFLLQEELLDVIGQVLEQCCPGSEVETHLLSSQQLAQHNPEVHSYAPRTILMMQLKGEDSLVLSNDDEKQTPSLQNGHSSSSGSESEEQELSTETREAFTDLACFGSTEVRNSLTLGVHLHITHISMHARRQLAARLDPPDPMGRDWCLLAIKLDLTENVPRFDLSPMGDCGNSEVASTTTKDTIESNGSLNGNGDSKVDRTLQEWSRYPNSTVAALIGRLEILGRQDVIDTILNSTPLYRVFRDVVEETVNGVRKTIYTPASSKQTENTITNGIR